MTNIRPRQWSALSVSRGEVGLSSAGWVPRWSRESNRSPYTPRALLLSPALALVRPRPRRSLAHTYCPLHKQLASRPVQAGSLPHVHLKVFGGGVEADGVGGGGVGPPHGDMGGVTDPFELLLQDDSAAAVQPPTSMRPSQVSRPPPHRRPLQCACHGEWRRGRLMPARRAPTGNIWASVACAPGAVRRGPCRLGCLATTRHALQVRRWTGRWGVLGLGQGGTCPPAYATRDPDDDTSVPPWLQSALTCQSVGHVVSGSGAYTCCMSSGGPGPFALLYGVWLQAARPQVHPMACSIPTRRNRQGRSRPRPRPLPERAQGPRPTARWRRAWRGPPAAG